MLPIQEILGNGNRKRNGTTSCEFQYVKLKSFIEFAH